MKKFDALGRSLSKMEQKKILGGDDEEIDGGGEGCPRPCCTDTDCGLTRIWCPDGREKIVAGRCNIYNCCRYSTVCV